MATAYEFATKQEEPGQDGSAPAVSVEDVHKTFGRYKVLNGVSLHVLRGRNSGRAGPERHRQECIASADCRP